ncbi:MAG: hypothetical protein U0414_28835 [Polyangiaceae bacterium]
MKPPVDDPVEMETLLRATPPERARSVSNTLVEAVRAPFRAAVAIAVGEGEPEPARDKAREIVARGGALAIAPMIERDRVPAPASVFALRAMLSASLALKARVEAKLEASLDDKEAIPVGETRRTEEIPRVRRVADVALFELRRMRHHGEDALVLGLDERAYYRSTFEERDAILAELRARGETRWHRPDGRVKP